MVRWDGDAERSGRDGGLQSRRGGEEESGWHPGRLSRQLRAAAASTKKNRVVPILEPF